MREREREKERKSTTKGQQTDRVSEGARETLISGEKMVINI